MGKWQSARAGLVNARNRLDLEYTKLVVGTLLAKDAIRERKTPLWTQSQAMQDDQRLCMYTRLLR